MNSSSTHARINDQLYLAIRWARVFDNTDSPRRAQFSGDLCMNDGTKICTINRLCILDTYDKQTGEPTLFIGSMSEKLSKGDTIYSLTWFPNSKYDANDLKARNDFAKRCSDAVNAFQKQEFSKMEKAKERQVHPHVKDMLSTATKIRSFLSRG